MVWPFSKKQKDPKQFSIADVEKLTSHLGLDLTRYGAGVALLSLESDYSPAETASQLALATIAHDMKEQPDVEKVMEISVRGYAVLECLKKFKDNGLMRESIWANDATAIAKIINPSPETEEWIDRVLSDPVVGRERVAVSRV